MPDKNKRLQAQQTAINEDIIQIVGDGNVVNNTVNQTIIQRFFN